MTIGRFKFKGHTGFLGYVKDKTYFLTIEEYPDEKVQMIPINPFRKSRLYQDINHFHESWERI